MTTTLAEREAQPTLNSAALAQLRSDILTCRLMPGAKLRVEGLRERYGMGTSPIREALMRLEAEGLVVLEQNKGFKVTDVSIDNLNDLMDTRIEIEGVALRWSIERGGVDWEASLLAAFHRLSKQEKFNPESPRAISNDWNREHEEFHAALVSACGAPTLLSIRSRLFEQAERYVSLSIMADGPSRDDVSEHQRLMKVALSRNVEKALEANRLHIEATRGKVAASLASKKKPAALSVVNRKPK